MVIATNANLHKGKDSGAHIDTNMLAKSGYAEHAKVKEYARRMVGVIVAKVGWR